MSKFEKTPLPTRKNRVEIESKSRFTPNKVSEIYMRAQLETGNERDVNRLVKFTKKD